MTNGSQKKTFSLGFLKEKTARIRAIRLVNKPSSKTTSSWVEGIILFPEFSDAEGESAVVVLDVKDFGESTGVEEDDAIA